MNDRLILSPPPAKNILLSSGEDIETAINKLNNSTNTNITEVKIKIEDLEKNINNLKSLTTSLNSSVNGLNQRYYCEVCYEHNPQDTSFTS